MLKIIVVKIDLDFVFDKYLHWFDVATQQKILSYRFHIDQVRSFTSELLKHYYLAHVLNLPHQQISIKNTDLGKPVITKRIDPSFLHACIRGNDDYPRSHHGSTYNNIHFNVSHSGDYVLMSVADKPVGIDIEGIDYKIDPLRLGETVFSPSENALINGDIKNFFMLWTKKEALFKAEGTGFINDYYNKTNLTLDLVEETRDYIISSTIFFEEYYLSICIQHRNLS